jgi:CRISPR-associated protein Cas5h
MSQTEIGEYESAETEEPTEEQQDSAEAWTPTECIGFDIGADFAHFRKVGNNSAKPSYRIPPRTTVAGILAAIMGMPRNSYYDVFEPDSSAIAVVPKEQPHTYTMGITTVNTNEEAIKYLPEEKHYTKSAEMLTPDSYISQDRQRDTYEMLVDPVYRVYVALAADDLFEELTERLEKSRYHYSPSLGLSECLADIRNVEMHSVESISAEAVDSAAYDDTEVRVEPGLNVRTERAQLYMEATDGGSSRRVTRYGSITHTPGDEPLPVASSQVSKVGSHRVLFY